MLIKYQTVSANWRWSWQAKHTLHIDSQHLWYLSLQWKSMQGCNGRLSVACASNLDLPYHYYWQKHRATKFGTSVVTGFARTKPESFSFTKIFFNIDPNLLFLFFVNIPARTHLPWGSSSSSMELTMPLICHKWLKIISDNTLQRPMLPKMTMPDK